MPNHQRQRIGLRALFAAMVLTAVFGLGSAVESFLAPPTFSKASDTDHSHSANSAAIADHDAINDHESDHEDEEDHLALTRQAFENLELRMGHVSRGEYWKSILVPGRVVEIPGHSSLSIPAPVTGIVDRVDLLAGQTIEAELPLFTIRITDEALINAQSQLLELLSRQEVAQQEIDRLQPLVSSGAVSGSKARGLRYEVRQLQAREAALRQELATRGMSETAIEQLIDDRQLMKLTTVFASDLPRRNRDPLAAADGQDSFGYSVESLAVQPGSAVQRGDALCTVAYHPTLYLKGTAFQDDLHVLERIIDQRWKITVETHEPGHQHGSDLQLELLRIENHVDEQTQTVQFFLELPNQVTFAREREGRKFEQWRFRPGQRLHLRLPVERWRDQLTLPADAVVVDGPNVFVFAQHHDAHNLAPEESSGGSPSLSLVTTQLASEQPQAASADEPLHDDEHHAFIELEPVPVRLLYRDDKTVVIADDGQLHSDDNIALNNAYQLYLAMKMQAGAGGGHHHHDH